MKDLRARYCFARDVPFPFILGTDRHVILHTANSDRLFPVLKPSVHTQLFRILSSSTTEVESHSIQLPCLVPLTASKDDFLHNGNLSGLS